MGHSAVSGIPRIHRVLRADWTGRTGCMDGGGVWLDSVGRGSGILCGLCFDPAGCAGVVNGHSFPRTSERKKRTSGAKARRHLSDLVAPPKSCPSQHANRGSLPSFHAPLAAPRAQVSAQQTSANLRHTPLVARTERGQEVRATACDTESMVT